MKSFIPLSVPNLKGNELKYVTKVIEDEWVSTGGSFIDDFEKVTAEYVHAKGAVACQSGTAGLHLALMVKDIGSEDEVIVPALTFIAAVNPVRYVGAHPIFMDCDDSLCMDMDKLERFCEQECSFEAGKLINRKSGRHIKAIIVVHIFGNMADMNKAVDIASRYNLTLIEDATETLGSYVTEGRFRGKFAGTIGDVGVYSYNGNKIITTGGGGMIVSDDQELLDRAKYLSTLAKDDPLYYVHDEIGYNYRMTNLQAAVGLAQMEQLETFIEIKANLYHTYLENGIDMLPFRAGVRSNYWFFSYITEKRNELIHFLNQNGIQSRPIWNLICELRPYTECQKYEIEDAVWYQQRIVNIPRSTNLLKEDVKQVANILGEFKWMGFIMTQE